MTAQEESHVRDVLKFFYPELSPVQTINSELADLAALMLKEALEGSKAMDLVPRPPGFMPGIGWLISQGVQTFWRMQGKKGFTRPYVYKWRERTAATTRSPKSRKTNAGDGAGLCGGRARRSDKQANNRDGFVADAMLAVQGAFRYQDRIRGGRRRRAILDLST
jgi:hypothetical protein